MISNRIFKTAILLCASFSAAACGIEEEGAKLQEAKGGDPQILAKTFTGKVVDANNVAIAGATVTVNGITRITSATGQYALSVVDNPLGYHLEVQKNGYGPASGFYLGNALSSVHRLTAGNTRSIDPTRANVILDQASGIEVSLSANGLRAQTGAAPVGAVRFTIVPLSAQTMPGDLTAVTSTGARVALETVGAVALQAADSQGTTLGLAPNATMTVKLPVPASAGGVMPPCVLNQPAVPRCTAAMWQFDRLRALWVQQPSAAVTFTSTATIFTPSAVAPPIEFGLGTWNADIFKSTPACTVIIWAVDNACFTSPGGTFTASITQTPFAAPINTTTRQVNATMAASVVYNIWPTTPTTVAISGTTCANKTFAHSPTPSTGVTASSVDFITAAPWGGVGYPANGLPAAPVAVSLADAVSGNHPCDSVLDVTLTP